MPPFVRSFFVGLGLVLMAVSSFAAQETRGYQIKAVFLLNFLRFVEWPPASFPTADSPIVIGVYGENPFGPALDDAVRNEIVRGRPVLVRYSRRLPDLLGCQVVFICASEKDHVPEILTRIDDGPVLTVGEVPDFAQHGGIIGFYPDGNRVRFAINPTVAERHGLKPSAQLLSLARIVGPPVKEP